MDNLISYIRKNILLYLAMLIMVFTWYAYQFYDFIGELRLYRDWLNTFDTFNLLFFVPLFLAIVFVVTTFARNNIKDIVRSFFHLWLVFFIAVFILGNLRLLPEDYFTKHTRIGFDLEVFWNNLQNFWKISQASDNSTRWDFGFNYPTVGALAYVALWLSYVYLNQDKLKRKHHLIFLGVTFLCYIFTLVRSLLIFMPVYFVIFVFAEELKKFIDKYGKLLYLVIPLGLLFSFIAPIFLGDNKLIIALTSYRVEIWKMYIESMPIRIINLYPDMSVFTERALDNAYLFPIYFAGIIPTLLLFSGYTLLIKYCLEKKDYYLLYIYVIWATYGLVEPTFFYNYNFLIYTLCPIVYYYIKKVINRKENLL